MDQLPCAAVAALPEDLLRRTDVPGPRDSSHPTADRFVGAFGPPEYVRAVQERARFSRIL